MYGRPLLIARIAVAELIDTLSENDFFNLIWVGIRIPVSILLSVRFLTLFVILHKEIV